MRKERSLLKIKVCLIALQPNEDVVLYTRRIGAGVDDGLLDIDVAAKLTHYGKSVDMGLFAVKEDSSMGSAGGEFVSSRIQRKANALTVGHRLTHVTRDLLEREATVQGLILDGTLAMK